METAFRNSIFVAALKTREEYDNVGQKVEAKKLPRHHGRNDSSQLWGTLLGA
jgi:hypothetical protein